MTGITDIRLDEVLLQYKGLGQLKSKTTYGNGHINNTFLLTYETSKEQEKRVILQELNQVVFKEPQKLMENISGVTSYLRKKITERGGDPERETLNLIPTDQGESYYVDSEGEFWRVYGYIEDATCYEQVKSPNDFYQSAVAFGNFQYMLAEYPARTLHEIIPGFHDTRKRVEALKRAIEADSCKRASQVQKEIAFALERESESDLFGTLLADNLLPLRVTHNDTKLNNVMIDDQTGKGICVIDLDTVMPGFSAHDFGDSIRFGANTAAEDETDLSKVSCDLKLFEVYMKGFLDGCRGTLTAKEIEMLPMGAKIMTYECGVRFLTDYLEGDVYFKTDREHHNLDRARTQFKLIEDMEQKWSTLEAIVRQYQNSSIGEE